MEDMGKENKEKGKKRLKLTRKCFECNQAAKEKNPLHRCSNCCNYFHNEHLEGSLSLCKLCLSLENSSSSSKAQPLISASKFGISSNTTEEPTPIKLKKKPVTESSSKEINNNIDSKATQSVGILEQVIPIGAGCGEKDELTLRLDSDEDSGTSHGQCND